MSKTKNKPQGKPTQRRGRHLKALPTQAPLPKLYNCTLPKNIPAGAVTHYMRVSDDRMVGLEIYPYDVAVLVTKTPLANYDVSCFCDHEGRLRLARFHSGPGGYVRLETVPEDGDPEVLILKPGEATEADVLRVAHIERDGKIVFDYGQGKKEGAE